MAPQTNPSLKTFDDLTERQQKACYAFGKKWGLPADDVAPHLDTFFKLSSGEVGLMEAERVTGLVLIDRTHPTLF